MLLFNLLLSLSFAQDAGTPPATEVSEWKLKNTTEVSLIVADGNTESETQVIKQENSITHGANVGSLKATFLKSEANGTKTGESWMYSPRYERIITESFNAFIAFTEESDKFAGYDRRQSWDLGGKYYFKKVENSEELFAELNYRSTKEKNILGNSETSDYGRFYAEWTKTWTATLSSKLWVEYLQNFESSDDYKLNFEPSLLVVMTKVLSLKLSYLTKYDNVSLATEKKDTLFTTSIVANF